MQPSEMIRQRRWDKMEWPSFFLNASPFFFFFFVYKSPMFPITYGRVYIQKECYVLKSSFLFPYLKAQTFLDSGPLKANINLEKALSTYS